MLGARDALCAYPVLAIAVSAVSIRRRGLPLVARSGPADVRWIAACTAIVVVVMVCFAVAYFPETPLPGAAGASYFPDYPWGLAIATEALHHWPIQDPHAAGTPQPYHYFVHLQMAATSQVTGLELPVVFFRLSPLPMVGLFVLQVAAAGESLLRSRWVGLIAACLALLVADLQMETAAAPFGQIPFLGLSFTLLFTSLSFLFGMVMFTPLMVLIGERLRAPDRGKVGEWLLISFFVAGSALGKVTILPLTLLSLLLFGAWSRLRRGSLPPGAAGAFLVVIVATGLSYLLLFRGHSSGLGLDPLTSFSQMPVVLSVKAYLLDALPDIPLLATALGAAGVVVGFLGLVAAQFAGIPWLLRRGSILTVDRAWLSALLISGLAILFLTASPGSTNQLYFVFLGVLAGCLLSAEGLTIAWRRLPRPLPHRGRVAMIAAGWVVALILLTVVPAHLFGGADSQAQRRLVAYGGLAISLGLLYAISRRLLRPERLVPAALSTVAVIVVGALALPYAYLAPSLTGSRVPIVPSVALSPDLDDALTWIREDVPFSDVIAVDTDSPLQFNYAAFSEHRVFVEGWIYSRDSFDAGFDNVIAGRANPESDRLAINRAAFSEADPDALRTMYTWTTGVRYLVIDEDGTDADVGPLERMFETVYENPQVTVLKVAGPS